MPFAVPQFSAVAEHSVTLERSAKDAEDKSQEEFEGAAEDDDMDPEEVGEVAAAIITTVWLGR